MIKAIFAVDSNGGIGNAGTLPWPHISEDFKWFKENTNGQIVIMGRNTWDDPKMPKPLPGRTCYVVTNRKIDVPGVKTINGDINEKIRTIANAWPHKTVWVIGGQEILETVRPIIGELYLTFIRGHYRVDRRIHLNRYLDGFRALSAIPGKQCTWMIYRNLMTHENIS